MIRYHLYSPSFLLLSMTSWVSYWKFISCLLWSESGVNLSLIPCLFHRSKEFIRSVLWSSSGGRNLYGQCIVSQKYLLTSGQVSNHMSRKQTSLNNQVNYIYIKPYSPEGGLDHLFIKQRFFYTKREVKYLNMPRKNEILVTPKFALIRKKTLIITSV